jgi:hypothetical protein
MLATKIHCDFMGIYGPDWAKLSQEQIDCLIEAVQRGEMLGTEGQLRGFVGTVRYENVVGGFFAIQYPDERLYYDRTKQLKRVQDTPFERVFFVFFAGTGKLILQNRKFADIPLKMTTVQELLRDAINQALMNCRAGHSIGFYLPKNEVGRDRFIEEFRRSTRVVTLEVTSPDPNRIPESFVYYNPQRERNSIIRGSHQHDYSNFRKVDLEASRNGNIAATHIGSDLILAGQPEEMKYFVEESEQILRRIVPTKQELYVDVDSPELSMAELTRVLEVLRRERSLDLDIPTPETPSNDQLSLFDLIHGENDAEN